MNGGIIKMDEFYHIQLENRIVYFKTCKKDKAIVKSKERKLAYFDYPISVIHRTDGPAIEEMGGYKEWWINGEQLSPEKEAILNEWWDNKK